MKQHNIITYLGHSAFLIETINYYLFFDYCGTSSWQDYQVEELSVDFDQYHNKKIIMFHSHAHFDHYNKDIHQQLKSNSNITFILGDVRTDDDRAIVMHPKEEKQVGDIMIYAFESSDIGACYLIEVDDLTIYYGGDNADWGGDIVANQIHYESIDSLAKMGKPIDIAFIPVCTFTGKRPLMMTKGAIYSVEALNPKLVIPVHSAGREWLYQEFAIDAKQAGITNFILCMEKLGQEYRLKQ